MEDMPWVLLIPPRDAVDGALDEICVPKAAPKGVDEDMALPNGDCCVPAFPPILFDCMLPKGDSAAGGWEFPNKDVCWFVDVLTLLLIEKGDFPAMHGVAPAALLTIFPSSGFRTLYLAASFLKSSASLF